MSEVKFLYLFLQMDGNLTKLEIADLAWSIIPSRHKEAPNIRTEKHEIELIVSD